MPTKTYKDTPYTKTLYNDGDVIAIQRADGEDTISMEKVTISDMIMGYGIYKRPSSGIPQTDLDIATRTAIEKVSEMDIKVSELETALDGKGQPNGIASLGADGKVPASQLPSFVDDVLEFSTFAAFPAVGEAGKIYIAKDTNKTYRWGGTVYVLISETITIGTTEGTAFSGKTGNDHVTDDDIHVTAEDKSEWSAKYDKPEGGIPKTDLASSVQDSLSKADSALQTHQDISGKADKIHVHMVSQITDFPTIPSVGNGTVTVTQGGVNKGSFTLNQSENTTITLDAGGGSQGDSTPIGTIIPFIGSTEPLGYFFCEGQYLDPTVYSKLFSVIEYTYGRSDDLFKLPDLRGRFLEGADEAGTFKEAGLPNLTGTAKMNTTSSAVGASAENSAIKSVISQTSNRYSYGSGSYYGADVVLNASANNPIYGNSDTVQPASLTVRYIIKAYDSVKTDTEVVEIEAQIASIISSKLNKRGDTLLNENGDIVITSDGKVWGAVFN